MEMKEKTLKIVDFNDVIECIEDLFNELVIYDFNSNNYDLVVEGSTVYFTIALRLTEPLTLDSDQIAINERLENFSKILTGISCGNLHLIEVLSSNLDDGSVCKKFYISCEYQIEIDDYDD